MEKLFLSFCLIDFVIRHGVKYEKANKIYNKVNFIVRFRDVIE